MVMTLEKAASAALNGPPIGVLAGSGPLPLEIAAAAIAAGRPVHIIGIQGFAPDAIESYPHSWVNLGQVGAMIRGFRQSGCADIVIAGGMRRPNLWRLKVDSGFFRCIGTVFQMTRGGDDSVLRRVVRFFELQGFRVCGAHEIAPQLLAPAGTLTRAQPDATHLAAIARGTAFINTLGVFDVGQAALANQDRILAAEGVRGTDAMLDDVATALGPETGWATRGAVLVKLPKPGQEMRVDLPVVGPHTIDRMMHAGLAGVAVRAGQSLILEREETIRRANAAGVFVSGVELEDQSISDRAVRAQYISAHDAPLAVLARRAPTPGERRDVAIGRALLRALAQHGAGDAAIIADQHVRGINGMLPVRAMAHGASAGNDWGRRLFRKRIGVLVVRRPDLVLPPTPATEAEHPVEVDFSWIAEAGLAGLVCVEEPIPHALLPAATGAANDTGLFLMGPEVNT